MSTHSFNVFVKQLMVDCVVFVSDTDLRGTWDDKAEHFVQVVSH